MIDFSMIKLVGLIVVAWLCFSLPVYADQLDFSTAYHKAVEYDAQFRTAHANYLDQKEEVAKAISQFRPSVHANAAQGRNETKSTTPSMFGGLQHQDQFYTSKTYGVSVQQPLFNLYNYADYKQAKAGEEKSEAELQKEKELLIIRVAEAYCNVLYSEDNLEYSLSHINATLEQLKQTKHRFEKGFGSITEISEAQAGYDMALAEGIDIKNGFEYNRRELEHFTGVYPEELCKLIPEKLVLSKPQPDNVESWIKVALTDNHDISAARLDIQIAKKEIDKQRAQRYPVLNLVAGRNYSESDNNYIIGSSYDTYSIGLQMSVPIYTGGYVSASVRQAQAKRIKANEQLSFKERFVESDVRKYYNGVIICISQIYAYEQAVKSGEVALKGTKKGFEAGLRTNTEVLDSEQKLLSSKRNLAKSRYQYILNRLQLKASVGTLAQSDVEEVNRWFGLVKNK